jgi:hypothetical protein
MPTAMRCSRRLGSAANLGTISAAHWGGFGLRLLRRGPVRFAVLRPDASSAYDPHITVTSKWPRPLPGVAVGPGATGMVPGPDLRTGRDAPDDRPSAEALTTEAEAGQAASQMTAVKTSRHSSRKPELCYCCRRPLTHIQKTVMRGTRHHPAGEPVREDSWECANQDCVSYRLLHPQIPTPPFTK